MPKALGSSVIIVVLLTNRLCLPSWTSYAVKRLAPEYVSRLCPSIRILGAERGTYAKCNSNPGQEPAQHLRVNWIVAFTPLTPYVGTKTAPHVACAPEVCHVMPTGTCLRPLYNS